MSCGVGECGHMDLGELVDGESTFVFSGTITIGDVKVDSDDVVTLVGSEGNFRIEVQHDPNA